VARSTPRDPGEAIRIGIPVHPLSDLYYTIMRARWRSLILVFVAAFLLGNSIFAALYASCGECIAGAQPGSFEDGFFFSVQTISTIGYGHLYPLTDAAEAIVTVESLVGLGGFAVATGLMFSKFAQPTAQVLFSDKIVIVPWDGEPTAMFRLANARGNDLVEASVRVAVLKPETTSEGHELRRLHDAELNRARTPLFSLSWVVMHTIDDDSPLRGETLETLEAQGCIVIVSFVGLDGTFGQTVYARHIYRPPDIVFGHRFVDVIDNTEDGRVVLDYRKFHDVEPMPEV
jgi:inward rectifier potassium channel